MSEIVNIARFLPEVAKNTPQKIAVVNTVKSAFGQLDYQKQTFFEVNQLADRYAHGFQKLGFQRDMKVLLAVKPGFDFAPLCFALFKLGVVPVLIDPGMGKENLLDCVKQVAPEAVIGVKAAIIASILYKSSFLSVKYRILVNSLLPIPFSTHLKSCLSKNKATFPVANTQAKDLAAIVFTTGSTGAPKGVNYFHSQMEAQVRLIREQFNISDSDIDLPIFPLFALFSIAFGITAVIPYLDPTRPKDADPAILVKQIQDHKVSFSIGSPALFEKLGAYCFKNKIKLASLKQVLMVGAPVRPYVLRPFTEVLIDGENKGETYTPYGATEALPVAYIKGSQILTKTATLTNKGMGTCIGYPFKEVEIKIIKIIDDAISELTDDILLEKEQIGEIIVKGPMVTEEYFNNLEATKLAKINDNGTIWHRMGDLGYFDQDNKLWFCGRKAHRVETKDTTYYSVCCEAIYNQHPKVFRSALVGITFNGKSRPIIIIEPHKDYFPKNKLASESFIAELNLIADRYSHTKTIKHILFHPSFPVDIRHNAKIFREKLSVFAKEKLMGA